MSSRKNLRHLSRASNSNVFQYVIQRVRRTHRGRDVMGIQPHESLRLRLDGYLRAGEPFARNVLFEQLFASLPRDPAAKVQIYNAEIAPGGYTDWHCHNGATFFIALQGIFEAHFQEGVLVKAKAGDVYSEPIARIHRGHNPHPDVPYLCIGIAITAPDREHVTNVEKPW